MSGYTHSPVVIGNTFQGTGYTATVLPSTANYVNIYGNPGYVNRASGKIQYTAAATVVVTHGLSAAPTKIILSGTNADTATLWYDTVGATYFTINRGNTTGTPWVSWYAEV